MNILVLSDLHICNGDSFGAFGWDDARFMNALDFIRVKHRIDRVVLNGDIFELYKYSYEDIEHAHRGLIDYFRENGFVYIRGNHDMISPDGFNHWDVVNSSGMSIHFEHGHSADFLNGTKLGRAIGFILMKILKALVALPRVRALYNRYLERDEEVKKPKKYNSYKYLKYALELLTEHDVVILGHTHKIEAHKTYRMDGKKRYLNSGSCCMGRFQGVVIDTETLKYDTIKLHEYDIMREIIADKQKSIA